MSLQWSRDSTLPAKSRAIIFGACMSSIRLAPKPAIMMSFTFRGSTPARSASNMASAAPSVLTIVQI